VVYATLLIFFSFYLQSAWTQARNFASWLEWLKLGLVFLIADFFPLSPVVITTLHVYLICSAFGLTWLNIHSFRKVTNAR